MSVSALTGAAAQIGDKLITSLPAQFLMLCLLNVFFVLGLLWFLHASDATRVAAQQREAELRQQLLAPILTVCIKQSNVVHDR